MYRAMATYDNHISLGEGRLRRRRNGRRKPIDYVVHEEARHERMYLSEWLHELPVQHGKIKPLSLRLRQR
jgi:hypothetical protein